MMQKVTLAPWIPVEDYARCDLLWLNGKDFQPLHTRGKYFNIRDEKCIKEMGITELHVYHQGEKVWELVI